MPQAVVTTQFGLYKAATELNALLDMTNTDAAAKWASTLEEV